MRFPKKKKSTYRVALIKRCSILWAKITKLQTSGRCGLCGSGYQVESHHIVKKGRIMHRGWFLLDNCIPLCFGCHYDGIHSLHFPTTQLYQEKIIAYLKEKGITYDALYQRCRNGPRMDVEELERVLEGLKDFPSEF